ncbi:serine/threonine protein kinase with WD-40 repeats [Leptolyngbya boryana NIES-2135]|jgi:WD40 repeat protein/tRNA A-37 threonylcarbamoyl transferase component Bud32|uniref:Serine/threonine protein kinase with WD-40 repeats n=1 Tax=Leptolyngbya boryana NIES-2135 TaxID=1973484 RepID=A0A1Z4JHE5_LEPBY|nr:MULTISPECIES: serine/threonine-protein kinase [Leptolyngbya]BAY56150.1 serine/threonine protein kinase with WD-40 repeats [Leptolyngbya boryana NIES-2135]MBD2366259.1 serine/threonine protein kinase [Leptolyngbya sp. FACHB-161]MBD2372439.1 serine/threonine protein kinase [Leptolyngbya sp. FACHB-238]MBD2396862.1 serine/threonine protein kinase [Leptolyngbya sp. FACHB-239]MBD2403385.1 serine/threonine protein kinase [Leptolyngbya sp. FACHB-402]
MTYCINPDCPQPQNPDGLDSCQTCGTTLIDRLRGRYRILEPLGQGGFGKTFLAADDDRLGTRCVIKQFSPQLKGTKGLEKAIQLFEQEAVRLHELGEHPHIPTLLAYFEQDQRLYLVQQFIEGSTLSQELNKNGPFSEQKIREVLVRLLPLLKFVHDRNVIHRDITPANIIRRNIDGRLVLIDFGIAKVLSEENASKPGTKIGTEGYAPIEQLRNGKAYPASDLYSLGATCLYLLTQVRPEDLHDPLSGKWLWRERLASHGGGISENIGQILDRMLKDLVSERYQTADEVMHDLRMALSKPAVGAAPQTSIPSRGRSIHLSAIAYPATQPPADLPSPLSAPQRVSTPPPPPSLPLSATRHSGIPKPQPRKCFYTLTGHTSWVVSLAISPDRRTLVSGSLDDRIMLWDLTTGERLGTLTGHKNSINSLAFSPDGRTLISASDDDSIKMWRLPTGEMIRSLQGHLRDVNSIAVSPDGSFFASGSEDRSIGIWRMNTGEMIHSFTGLSGMVKTVAISPNGQILASGGLNNLVKLWNLITGQPVRELAGHQNSITSIVISSDGKHLVSASKDKTIKIWEPNTGQVVQTLTGHSDIINSVAITPDSKTLISGSNDKTVKLWNLNTGDLICTLTDHSHSVNAIAMSSDGQWFASGSSDNTIKVWQTFP